MPPKRKRDVPAAAAAAVDDSEPYDVVAGEVSFKFIPLLSLANSARRLWQWTNEKKKKTAPKKKKKKTAFSGFVC
jgi:hypothetical protein